MEKLVECKRCSSNACYEQQVNEEVTTWLCMGCGFTTSTLMTEGSTIVQQAIETSPELYKDLMSTDSDGRVWMPSTLTLPNKGMVFLDGTSKDSYEWAAVKAIPLQEGDKKINEGQTHKMDMETKRDFPEREYMDALSYIEVIPE